MNEHERWFLRMDWLRREKIIGIKKLQERFRLCNPILCASADFRTQMLLQQWREEGRG